MQYNYFSQALMQEMLYLNNLREIDQLQQQIIMLKQAISSKQKKHRRCDKQILKCFQCQYCLKKYASDVSLKLHMKLKHQHEHEHGRERERETEKNHHEDRSTSHYIDQISMSHGV